MAGSHIGSTPLDNEKEQRDIDQLIESLLQFKPSGKPNTETQTSVTTTLLTPKNTGAKPRGRPPKNKQAIESPKLPTAKPSECIISAPSFEVLLECINKLNQQNKNLQNRVSELESLVHDQSIKIDRLNLKTTESPLQHDLVTPNNSLSPNQKSALDGVTNRLEKIEQNLNSNTLICRGPAVESLVTESAVGESDNLERLKGEVCKAVCGDETTGVDVLNLKLRLFGRDKKSIRLDCMSSPSKVHLLKQARLKKPQGIYVSEFLTTSKLSVFHNLRLLKKQHPRKIKSVFTREGNIFYRLQDSDRVTQVTSLEDLSKIIVPEANVTNATEDVTHTT